MASYRTYPNQRALNDAYVSALTQIAKKFWLDRGVKVPDDVAIDVADDVAGDDAPYALARAYDSKSSAGSRIVFDGWNLGVELRRARSKRRSAKQRRAALESIGTMLTHELGHVAGTGHNSDPKGVMADTIGASVQVPWDVRLKARELIPSPPKKRRARDSAKRVLA